MKKIISFFLASFCFLGSVSAQNPTLVYGTNDVKVTGGPVGKVLVPTNFVGRTIANGPMTVLLSNSAGIHVTGGNINMHGLPIVNLATATTGTNAVNLTQLIAATNAMSGQFIAATNGVGTNVTIQGGSISGIQLGLMNCTNYTSPGINTWTNTGTNTASIYVEIFGAGGGGSATAGNARSGGGGGGYCAGWFRGLTNGQFLSFTNGTRGGGAAGGGINTGTNGTASVFQGMSAGGGAGGGASGGAGGVATGSPNGININGCVGGANLSTTIAGSGGNCPRGGFGGPFDQTGSINGTYPGGGGSAGTGPSAGGWGTNGMTTIHHGN